LKGESKSYYRDRDLRISREKLITMTEDLMRARANLIGERADLIWEREIITERENC